MSANMRELGTTGLRRTGGFVIDDFLPQLQGIKGVRVYREMADNDPTIGAILFAIEKVLQRLEWRVDPADDDDETAKEYAEFIEGCLYDMSDSWDATLSAILSMLTYGWSWHEVVYKKRQGYNKDPRKRSLHDDGKIGWRKWAIRSQETLWEWEFDEEGGIQGFWQVDPSTNAHRVFIPIEKALLFRTTTVKNNPEGRSLLRNAYRSWWYKRRIEEIEAVGIERDLAGLPVAHVPPEYLSSAATPEQVGILNAIKDIVTGIKRNEQEGVIYPAMYDQQGNRMFELTLMSSGGARQFDIDKTVARYDQRIAMTLLSDFILLGHERVGSFALGTAKMDLWSVAVDAVARSIAEVVNQHAIPRLLRLNGMDDELAPELAYGEVAVTDIAEVAKFVVDLIGAGVIQPDGVLDEYMRDLGGLPAPDPDSVQAMPGGQMPQMPGMDPMAAETGGEDPFGALPSIEEVMGGTVDLEEPDITAEN
jgi:hypothetical protein